ncbi:MAG: hypothetical protein VB050_11655 [Geobacteraceae bacterium]|nr:hypothetical protein [Geobacteraceae bacterium]
MSDEVTRIGKVNPTRENGTGSARKRKCGKQILHHEERDSVVISDEAKQRCENDALEDDTFNES